MLNKRQDLNRNIRPPPSPSHPSQLRTQNPETSGSSFLRCRHRHARPTHRPAAVGASPGYRLPPTPICAPPTPKPGSLTPSINLTPPLPGYTPGVLGRDTCPVSMSLSRHRRSGAWVWPRGRAPTGSREGGRRYDGGYWVWGEAGGGE